MLPHVNLFKNVFCLYKVITGKPEASSLSLALTALALLKMYESETYKTLAVLKLSVTRLLSLIVEIILDIWHAL